jgi:hypothetical protein
MKMEAIKSSEILAQTYQSIGLCHKTENQNMMLIVYPFSALIYLAALSEQQSSVLRVGGLRI